jgi:predicted RNA binding protein YcfA (HicA-like mRNA interferase family)
MGKLPRISGLDMIKILEAHGFSRVRTKGSHVTLHKDQYRTVVPLHNDLSPGTLLAILKQSGLSRNIFEK